MGIKPAEFFSHPLVQQMAVTYKTNKRANFGISQCLGAVLIRIISVYKADTSMLGFCTVGKMLHHNMHLVRRSLDRNSGIYEALSPRWDSLTTACIVFMPNCLQLILRRPSVDRAM